jgi:hypothetical protein
MWRLVKEDEEWMLVGFEIALPSLLEMAKDLDLDIPYDHPALQEIYGRRDLKLNKYDIQCSTTYLILTILMDLD